VTDTGRQVTVSSGTVRTLVLELDELDSVRALFRHRNPSEPADSGAVLELDRDQWQDLGNPAEVLVTLATLSSSV
jgi:hypothetical protein